MAVIDYILSNIYLCVALLLLTLNGVLYTHNLLKDKTKGWKIELFGVIVGYFIFSVLMFKMSNFI